MRRLAIVLAMVLTFTGGLTVAAQLVQAQDDGMATQGHVLVGAWLADTEETDANPFDAVFLFHDDGTYVEFDAAGEDSPGETDGGVWSPTGPQTADLTIVQVVTNDEGVNGKFTIRASIQVADDGQSFTAQYTFELDEATGMVGEYGPGTVTATRITVEPMGTPVGSIEDLFGQFEEGATPEATPTA
jgi:hypothetical protein